MKFLEYLISNLKLKIVSLLIALFIWLAITTIGENRENIYVPIVVTGLKKDTILVKLDPEGVFVKVKGAISDLKNLRKNELKVNVHLAELSEGYHTYHIEKKNVVLPKGIKIEEIHPDTVTVELDKLVKKRFKVVLKMNDNVSKNYSVQYYHPKYVEVEGAEKTLARSTDIETLPLKVNTEGKEAELTVGLNTEKMVIKSIVPPAVKVKLIRRR